MVSGARSLPGSRAQGIGRRLNLLRQRPQFALKRGAGVGAPARLVSPRRCGSMAGVATKSLRFVLWTQVSKGDEYIAGPGSPSAPLDAILPYGIATGTFGP